MPHIQDKEFGEVTIRRSALSRSVKLSVAPNGSVRISMPTYAPLFLAKRLIQSSRNSIRSMLSRQQTITYADGMQVGKSHHLQITENTSYTATKSGQVIHVTIPDSTQIESKPTQDFIRKQVITALRKEAKSYLPRRLEFLAKEHGFSYSLVRFSHASTRWGSCNSKGVISLNVALMKLDFDEIDYVLLHELTHTKHMNHSEAFWNLLRSTYPNADAVRRRLKDQTPSL